MKFELLITLTNTNLRALLIVAALINRISQHIELEGNVQDDQEKPKIIQKCILVFSGKQFSYN